MNPLEIYQNIPEWIVMRSKRNAQFLLLVLYYCFGVLVICITVWVYFTGEHCHNCPKGGFDMDKVMW